ncbi:ABC transporter permease [Shewanella schlegeliana]|uniref:ABC transporter permease n=1 Tax=Shewanella schlegeliana TaxID=190308 RepID=A0ABS1T216_9GAMM|nr:ABC transporter permease [Shewanella schlegeliana]MBL4914635.1 ABC transporter permease [Shewanella schlegeliana]MCL1109549.1 ABC transporter permease [Shewanella schlegeliana]GIU29662.1 ABC transporter permease [Shewanella schlegeliana]
MGHFFNPVLFVLAWRNLWRNGRRTLILLLAVSFGVWSMIVVSAFLRGMVDGMNQTSLNNLPGEIQLHQRDFLNDQNVMNHIPEPTDALLQQLNQSWITQWASRVRSPVMLASERVTLGSQLIAIAPQQEPFTVSELELVAGRMLKDGEDNGIVIGQKMATRLKTELNKRVVITLQDVDNEIAESGARVVGIYHKPTEQEELATIYAGKGFIQKLLNMQGKVTEIALFTDANQPLELVVSSLEGAIDDSYDVATWRELNGYLAAISDLMNSYIIIFIVIVFCVLGFGLANTLLMSIFERQQEIGLILALGLQSKAVILMIVIEAVLLLITGLIFGDVLALLTANALSAGVDLSSIADGLAMAGMDTTLYPVIYSQDVIAANIIVMVLGIITSLWPAIKAARSNPIESINTAA